MRAPPADSLLPSSTCCCFALLCFSLPPPIISSSSSSSSSAKICMNCVVFFCCMQPYNALDESAKVGRLGSVAKWKDPAKELAPIVERRRRIEILRLCSYSTFLIRFEPQNVDSRSNKRARTDRKQKNNLITTRI